MPIVQFQRRCETREVGNFGSRRVAVSPADPPANRVAFDAPFRRIQELLLLSFYYTMKFIGSVIHVLLLMHV